VPPEVLGNSCFSQNPEAVNMEQAAVGHCNKVGVGASAHNAETHSARSPGICGEPDVAEC
jgi:hypothetical protein